MAVDCPFCRIISKEIAAEIVYEDEEIVSFRMLIRWLGASADCPAQTYFLLADLKARILC